ncbi:unnamed protein product [Soboliphyme baturini]|uniref:Pre-mRNA-splicing regulator WTAP n=1 Tax=Soboliphyme baturini TaxID=241478 RepID=A0A183ISJ7_9BILA|nr:unnamed protein product [Soboliphyme baturini]
MPCPRLPEGDVQVLIARRLFAAWSLLGNPGKDRAGIIFDDVNTMLDRLKVSSPDLSLHEVLLLPEPLLRIIPCIFQRRLEPDVDASQFDKLSKDDLILKLTQLHSYVERLEAKSCDRPDQPKLAASDGTSDIVGQEERLRQQQLEASRRENVLVMRLTTKEQEVQEYLSQLEEIRSGVGASVRNVLLDPAVNSLFQKMKQELKESKEKLEQSQQELNAWKFTPDRPFFGDKAHF